MGMRNYDAWKLRSPYEGQELPGWAEDWLGYRLFVEEEDAEGEVEDVAIYGDQDEDGYHSVVEFIVRFDELRTTRTVSLTELEEAKANGDRLVAKPPAPRLQLPEVPITIADFETGLGEIGDEPF